MISKLIKKRSVIAIFSILGFVLCFQTGIAQTLSENEWTEPQNISNSGIADFPTIIADKSGTVHAFWAENTDLESGFLNTIFYSHFDGQFWSQPVDILHSPEGENAQASFPSVAIDENGKIHLLFVGGHAGTIYYSSAWIHEAMDARAWSPPINISNITNDAGSPNIWIDANNSMHVVYKIGLGLQQGIYYLQSIDGGETWTSTTQIPGTNHGEDTLIDHTRMAISNDGDIHITWMWTELSAKSPQQGIYYVRSTGNSDLWEYPLMVADGPFDSPGIIVDNQNNVHIIFSGTGQDRHKFHQRSTDGGETWLNPTIILSPGGYQGYSGMVLDSTGTLHLAIPSSHTEFVDSVFSLQWTGTQWIGPDLIIGGPEGIGMNVRNVAITVSEGNLLHVVTQYPVEKSEKIGGDIFYVRGKTDAPRVAPIAVKSPIVVSTTTTPPTITPDVTSASSDPESNIIAVVKGSVSSTLNSNPWSPILAGALPVFLIVLIVALLRGNLRGRR